MGVPNGMKALGRQPCDKGYTCPDSGKGFIPCTPDTPGAEPDLNRFLADYEWSQSGSCYVKRKRP
jgi:hypothetical protein